MTVFLSIAGCLLFSLGAIFMVSTIVPTSWDMSWAEQKDAFRRTARRFWFRIGTGMVAIGLIMMIPYVLTAFLL